MTVADIEKFNNRSSTYSLRIFPLEFVLSIGSSLHEVEMKDSTGTSGQISGKMEVLKK